jgi:hypothetical protein
MNDHERVQELLAAAALDGLDPTDEAALGAEIQEHLRGCLECRRDERAFDLVAGRLAFTPDPAPLRPGLEDELLERATGRATATPTASLGAARTRRRGGAWRVAVGIAAGFVLFAGGWLVRDVTAPAEDSDSLAVAGARVVTFEGSDGNLSIAYRPGREGVYIVGSELPAPPEGMVYEVWMIQDEVPVAGPCLSPDPSGTLFTYVKAELGTTDTMAVTVEASSCPSEPTSEPILTADLTTT